MSDGDDSKKEVKGNARMVSTPGASFPYSFVPEFKLPLTGVDPKACRWYVEA
jgi:hypothetical protein